MARDREMALGAYWGVFEKTHTKTFFRKIIQGTRGLDSETSAQQGSVGI